jgi:hypothetical protein
MASNGPNQLLQTSAAGCMKKTRVCADSLDDKTIILCDQSKFFSGKSPNFAQTGGSRHSTLTNIT